MKFADLHLHSLFSDGTYTCEELIRESIRAGLSAIALVDHDTVDGIGHTLTIARMNNIEVLPGIELTAEYNGLEIHILGYLIDYKDEGLRERLDFLRKNRIERAYKIIEKLKAMGINLKVEAVFDIAKQGTVGRLHIARAMLKEGIINSIPEAFGKYIGDKAPAYVCHFKFTPLEAINLIKRIGGIPVLAHPYVNACDELIPEFVNYGIMGLEVYYPEHGPTLERKYLQLAEKYNLLVTGGSDCHGNAKPGVKIGSVKIPYELVDKLKEAKQGLLG